MIKKYAYKDDRFSSHNQIAKLIQSNTQVLDVGCYDGIIGRLIRNKGCTVFGIDKDKEAARRCRGAYKRVFTLDLEASVPKIKERFDYIVFADVLEHLRNPDAVLALFSKFLKKGGRIIVSLPNVANIYMRLNLLFGRFGYQDKGILDRTHLRFFTLKSATQLLRRFEIERIKFTPIPIQLVYPSLSKFGIIYNFLYLLAVLFPTIFAYQFVLVAKRQ